MLSGRARLMPLAGLVLLPSWRRLAARLPERKLAGRLVARSLVWGVRQEASLLLWHWWPVTALLLVASRRFRRTVALALVVDARADHPDLGPLDAALSRRPVDLAYGAGVWWGCLRAASWRALVPRRV